MSFAGATVADIPLLIRLTRKTRRVIRQNLGWAIIYNIVAIPLAMLGFIHPAIAAAAMALSSISIVLNATRARLPTRAHCAVLAMQGSMRTDRFLEFYCLESYCLRTR